MQENIPKIDLDFVFGADSFGLTSKERSLSSKIKFIYGKYQISEYQGKGTGTVISASEALEKFGFDILMEAIDKGSAYILKGK